MSWSVATSRFFLFLGTEGGALLRNAVEALLLLLITYMVTSEFRRTRQKSLHLLQWAFLALSLQRIYLAAVLAYHFFGGTDLVVSIEALAIFFNGLEVAGLGLIGSAFVYPLYAKRADKFNKMITAQLLLVGGFFFILTLFSRFGFSALEFSPQWRSIILVAAFEISKILILAFPAFLLVHNQERRQKYQWSIVAALAVYAIGPMMNLWNLIIFDYHHRIFRILALPFSLFAILLFTRVIFLKLVDKALMRHKLAVAEAQLHQTEELSKQKDEFISIVGHELRTPLTSMNLYASLLQDGQMGQTNEKQKDALQIIKTEIKRLSNLINDILDLSKLEQRKVRLRLEEVNLHDLVETNSHRNLAAQKHINVENKVPKSLVIRADPDKMAQIIINLLSNAIKFTPDHGRVTITGVEHPKTWEISVADTGQGIPKDKQGRLFEKFFQVDDYLTREKGGTGLGLAIVHSLIRLHKGTIRVYSVEGKGSTFTILLPKKLPRRIVGTIPGLSIL